MTYRNVRLLERGGFSSVYLGKTLEDGTSVVLKHVDKFKLTPFLMFEDVPTEIFILNLLKKVPNVLHMLDWYETNKSFIIVSEYKPNMTDAFNFVKENHPLEEGIVQEIFRRVVISVETIRSKEVFHSDIKLENVLIDTITRDVLIIDFGQAKLVSGRVYRGRFGTTAYLPPEVMYEGWGTEVGITVFSLGVLLYGFLYHAAPYLTKEYGVDSFDGITKPSFEMRNDVSDAAKNLIQSCIEPDPLNRLTMMELRRHPWLTLKKP